MNEMNNRFIELRKSLNLTQKEMGDAIGISNSGVSNIEKGLRSVTEKHIRLLSVTFHINEEWLRTGEGEMMATSANTVFDEFAQHYALTREEQATARFLLNLSRDERTAVLQYVKRLAAELAKIEE